MDDNEAIVATFNIPKARTCDIKIPCKKTIKIRKPDKKPLSISDASLKKYNLIEPTPLSAKTLEIDTIYRSYASFAKKQRSLVHKQRLAIGLIEKYKIQYIDLRKRLHVDHPEDDVYAVTDYDETFFNYLNGRPLPEHKITVYKTLKTSLSKRLRFRHEIGCRRDCVLNIEANRRRENKIYQISLDRYRSYVKSFDIFISDDYNKSMEFLNKCEVFEKEVLEEAQRLEHLATHKFLIVSRLIGLDYLYSVQQKYGRFLFYLSPPSWRYQHREFARSVEIEAKGFDLGTNSDEDTFNVIFEKMSRECQCGLIKPALFFTRPEHLINLISAFEEQQLNHITYLNYLGPLARKMIKGIKHLKLQNEADSATVVYMIKYFQAQLEFAEQQEAYLEYKFYKVLYGAFFDSVGAQEVFKLKTELEFCYEKVYQDQPNNMTISTIARHIENYYMDYCMKLDEIHSNGVKTATKQFIESEKKLLKQAQKATRELRMFSLMEKALHESFAPASQKLAVVPKAVWLAKIPKGKVTSKKKSRQLTETEKEYLCLFTDWDNDEDPGRYIHFDDEYDNTRAPVVIASKKDNK